MERPEATTDGADYGGLKTLVEATIAALDHVPRELSGDVGFCNETNIEAGIKGYVAPGRARHGKSGDVGKWRIKPGTRMTAMARRALQPLSAQKADRRARRRPDQSRLPVRDVDPSNRLGARTRKGDGYARTVRQVA